MPVIGVSDFLKVIEFAFGRYNVSKEERRKHIEGWPDSVYSDLKELSDVWQKIVATNRLSVIEYRYVARKIDEEVLLHSNIGMTGSLLEFYRAASSVLPEKNPFREDFIHSLAQFLRTRNEARAIVDRRSLIIDMTSADQEQLKNAALELQKQAAILKAQIATLKATAW
jgi:hypothetical protein